MCPGGGLQPCGTCKHGECKGLVTSPCRTPSQRALAGRGGGKMDPLSHGTRKIELGVINSRACHGLNCVPQKKGDSVPYFPTLAPGKRP